MDAPAAPRPSVLAPERLIVLLPVGAVTLGVLVLMALNFEGVLSWFDFVASRPGDIASLSLEHLLLVAVPVVSATVVAVAVGVAVHGGAGSGRETIGRSIARSGSLTTASVLLTVPSLALFAIFIPVFGLGFLPSAVALFLYSLLPILRNTITGLQEVDPAVVESAKGMGLSDRQVLLQVKLPLAWPVILTGIRVAATVAASIAAIATLIAGGGLGDFIKDGLARYPLPTSVERLWTGTIFVIIIALSLDRLLAFVQKLTTPEGIDPEAD